MNKPKMSQTADRDVELAEQVLHLKHQEKATILAYNYHRGKVQDMVDFIIDYEVQI